MPRSKNGTRRRERRRKILSSAKGYWGGRSRLFKTAKEAVMKGLVSSYRDRKRRRGEFRRLWIARLSAACRAEGIIYSDFIHGLGQAGVQINRKALSNMAIEDPTAFKAIVAKAKEAQGQGRSKASADRDVGATAAPQSQERPKAGAGKGAAASGAAKK